MRDLNQREIDMVDGAGLGEALDKLKDTADKAWKEVKDGVKEALKKL